MQSTRYSCQILTKLEFSRHIFEKHLNIKFHKNPSSGSRVVPCGRAGGQTDTKKLTVAFRNVANAPKSVFMFTEVVRIRTTERCAGKHDRVIRRLLSFCNSFLSLPLVLK
jgi:hypothetical protein